MNWSAFFAGAPEGFQKGMKFTQDYTQKQKTDPLDVQKQQLANQQQQLANQQSQAMNPLQQAHQGLQNQQLGQNISQGGQNFAQGQGALDVFARNPSAFGHASGGGNIPQGMPPTTQPYGGMANMPHIGGIPQGAGGYMMRPPQNPYATPQPYYQQPQMYNPQGGGFQ